MVGDSYANRLITRGAITLSHARVAPSRSASPGPRNPASLAALAPDCPCHCPQARPQERRGLGVGCRAHGEQGGRGVPDSPRQRGSYGRRPRRSKARFAANGRRGGCAQPTDAGRGRGQPFQAGMLWMLWLDPHGHTREHPAAGGGTNGQTGDQADRQDRHRCGRRRSTRASARARSGAAGGDDSTFNVDCGCPFRWSS